jgi:hypothetical protein
MVPNLTNDVKLINDGQQHRRLIIFIQKKSLSLFSIPRLKKEHKNQYRKDDNNAGCKNGEFERDFSRSF